MAPSPSSLLTLLVLVHKQRHGRHSTMLLSVSRRQTEARANAGKAQEGPGALHWQLLALRGDSESTTTSGM